MIVDAHHHIWRQADLPWLSGPEQPRIFGPYAPIRRDYPIEEYLDDIHGTGIGKSVYVQTNWPPDRYVDEVAWVSETAARTGWPHAIVGYADVTGACASRTRNQLDRLAGFPLVRGIRQQFHWHGNPAWRFADRPDLSEDSAVQANIATFAEYGWSFELQLFSGQMEGGRRLATACPDVTFVLPHAGMPEDRSTAGLAVWRAGLERLAVCPNVCVKLSGLGTFIHRNDPEHIAEITQTTLGLFGAERCMFGSNFPIEKLWTGLAELVSAFREAVAAVLDDAGQAQVFSETARRVYGI